MLTETLNQAKASPQSFFSCSPAGDVGDDGSSDVDVADDGDGRDRANPTGSAGTAQRWLVCSTVVAPSDMGVPASCRRRYSAAILLAVIKPMASVPFEAVYFRTLMVDACVYVLGCWRRW